MRRSTVLSLPLHEGFPVYGFTATPIHLKKKPDELANAVHALWRNGREVGGFNPTRERGEVNN